MEIDDEWHSKFTPEERADMCMATGGISELVLNDIKAPQLGQNYLTSQYNNLTGLANMGLGAASQGAAGYQQLGQNQAYGLNQIGMGRAQQQVAGQTAQNQALQSGINNIGSAEMMKAQGDLYSEMARSGTLRGKAGPIKTAEDKPLNPKLFISGKHNFISRQYER